MRTTRQSPSTFLSRVRTRREASRGRRELDLALAGYYGRGVQNDVLAAQARKR